VNIDRSIGVSNEIRLETHYIHITVIVPQQYSANQDMKYGEHLKANVAPEYGPEPYLDYDKLDETIRVLSRSVPSA
jgi:hypothetical protein